MNTITQSSHLQISAEQADRNERRMAAWRQRMVAWQIMNEINLARELALKIRMRTSREKCPVYGHDYGHSVTADPSILIFCHHCGKELFNLTHKDLRPRTPDTHQPIADYYSTDDEDHAA